MKATAAATATVATIAIAGGCLAFLNVLGITGNPAFLSSYDETTSSSSRHNDQLAKKESFGFVDDVSDQSWTRIKARTHEFVQYAYPDQPWMNHRDPVQWHLDNMEPVFSCLHAQRIGKRGPVQGHGDGPKWVCNPHRLAAMQDCLVYSVGSNGDYSFEEGIIHVAGKNKCEIHVFDPGNYARSDDAKINNIHYHTWGLRSSSAKDTRYEHENFKSFSEIQVLLGHEHRTITILKIDCEACEWTTYKDWIGHDIRQILVEVHGVPSPYEPNRFYYNEPFNVANFFDAFVRNDYALFSKEVNVYHPYNVEYAFIKLHADFWKVAATGEHAGLLPPSSYRLPPPLRPTSTVAKFTPTDPTNRK